MSALKYQIEQDLITELEIQSEDINPFRIEYNDAYSKTIESIPNASVEVIKNTIKNILIEKLMANAERPHKTIGGKIGAGISFVVAKLLPHVKIKVNKYEKK